MYCCGKIYKIDIPLARKARHVLRDRMLPNYKKEKK